MSGTNGSGRRRGSSRGNAATLQIRDLSEEEMVTFGRPRCLCFGHNRREVPQFKGFFFCTPCDNAEEYRSSTGQWPDLNSRRNQCTSSHSDWKYPTQRVEVNSNLFRGTKDSEDEDEPETPNYLTETAPKEASTTFYLAHAGDSTAAVHQDGEPVGELIGIVGLQRESGGRRDGRRPETNGTDNDPLCLSLMWAKIRYQRKGITTAILLAALKNEPGSTVVVSKPNPSESGKKFYRGHQFRWNGICYAKSVDDLRADLTVKTERSDHGFSHRHQSWPESAIAIYARRDDDTADHSDGKAAGGEDEVRAAASTPTPGSKRPRNNGTPGGYQTPVSYGKKKQRQVGSKGSGLRKTFGDDRQRLREEIQRLKAVHKATVEQLKAGHKAALRRIDKRHQRTLATLRQSVDAYRKKSLRAEERMAQTEMSDTTLKQKPDSFRIGLMLWIEEYARRFYPTTGPKTRATEISHAVWDCLDGAARPELRARVVEEIKKMFSPWRLLMMMDLGDGSVNYAFRRGENKLRSYQHRLRWHPSVESHQFNDYWHQNVRRAGLQFIHSVKADRQGDGKIEPSE